MGGSLRIQVAKTEAKIGSELKMIPVSAADTYCCTLVCPQSTAAVVTSPIHASIVISGAVHDLSASKPPPPMCPSAGVAAAVVVAAAAAVSVVAATAVPPPATTAAPPAADAAAVAVASVTEWGSKAKRFGTASKSSMANQHRLANTSTANCHAVSCSTFPGCSSTCFSMRAYMRPNPSAAPTHHASPTLNEESTAARSDLPPTSSRAVPASARPTAAQVDALMPRALPEGPANPRPDAMGATTVKRQQMKAPLEASVKCSPMA
mmetsp:Transcript_78673/g.157335  ORF Transcript_78673/g.157335 Transcript_78673/m.157335 type:complete len:264 (+) Transcript_78673:375-1166(+)